MDPNGLLKTFERPASPAIHLQLNDSVAAQLQTTRKNLVGRFAEAAAANDQDQSLVVGNAGAQCLNAFLRIRPFSNAELTSKENQNCVQILSPTTVLLCPPVSSSAYKNAKASGNEPQMEEFSFTRVFNANATQKDFHEATARQYVVDLVKGHSGLIFSYGVTNAGKTFTIQGTDNDPGILPRTLGELFRILDNKLVDEPSLKPQLFDGAEPFTEEDRDHMARTKAELFCLLTPGALEMLYNGTANSTTLSTQSTNSDASLPSASTAFSEDGSRFADADNEYVDVAPKPPVMLSDNCKISVWVSFYEIYNEQVYDLLVPLVHGKNRRRAVLRVAEDRDKRVFLKNLRELHVKSMEEAVKLAVIGQNNLTFASTKLNYSSSRSHCIFTIRLMKECDDGDGPTLLHTSRLSFCDLAGSERTSKTSNTGQRVKEAGHINYSLLVLGRCISTLRWNQSRRNNLQVIPYRDTKLTRLFQDYLGGRCKACMIVNISQCASTFDETLHVLKFSSIAKKVRTAVSIIPSEPAPRFSTLLKAQDADKDKTILWASTVAPVAEVEPVDEETVSSPLRTPRHQSEGGEEEEESEASEDDENDDQNRTVLGHDEIIAKHKELIFYLRNKYYDEKRKVLEERNKNQRLEAEIREEVCAEYARMMAEREEFMMQQRREEVEDVERLGDERLELYVQAVKRRRQTEGKVSTAVDSDDDDETYVPVARLQEEQTKREDADREVARLKLELQNQQDIKPAVCEIKTSNVNIAAQTDAIEEENVDNLKEKIAALTETLEEAADVYKKQEAEIDALKTQLEAKNAPEPRGRQEQVFVDVKPKTVESQLAGDENKRFSGDIFEENVSSELKSPRCSVDVDNACGAARLESDEGFKLIELESKIYDLEASLENAKKRADDAQILYDASVEKEQCLNETLSQLEEKLKIESETARKSQEFQLRVDELNSKIEILEKQLEEARRNEDVLRTENCTLDEKQRKTVEEIAILREDFKRHFNENLEKLTREEEKTKNVTEELEKMKKILEETENKLRVSDEENGNLRKRISDLENSTRILEESKIAFQTKLDLIEKRNAELESAAKMLEEKMQKTTTDLSEERKISAEKMEKMTELSEELKRVMSALEDAEKDRRSSLEHGNVLRQQLHDSKSELVTVKKEKLDINTEKSKLNDEIVVAKRAIEALQAHLSSEQRIVANIREEFAQLEKTASDFKKKYEETLLEKKTEFEKAAHLQMECSKAQTTAIVEQKRNNQLETNLNVQKQTVTKLQGDKEVLARKIADMETMMERLSTKVTDLEAENLRLNQAVTEYAQRANDLKNENEALKRDSSEKSKSKHLLAESERRFQDLERRHNETTKMFEAKEQHIKEITQNLETMNTKLESAEQRYRQAEEENRNLLCKYEAEKERFKGDVQPVIQPSMGRRAMAKQAAAAAAAAAAAEIDDADVIDVQVSTSPIEPAKTSTRGRPPLPKPSDSTSMVADDSTMPNAGVKKSRGRGRKPQKAEDTETDTTLSSRSRTTSRSRSRNVSPKNTQKKNRKNEESTTSEPRPNMDASAALSKILNSDRPTRRAKQDARDAILAHSLDTAPRNTASTEFSAHSDEDLASTSTEAPTQKVATAGLPPKKRTRQLYEPTKPDFTYLSPAPDFRGQDVSHNTTTTDQSTPPKIMKKSTQKSSK